jgi:hypothetical protein
MATADSKSMPKPGTKGKPLPDAAVPLQTKPPTPRPVKHPTGAPYFEETR